MLIADTNYDDLYVRAFGFGTNLGAENNMMIEEVSSPGSLVLPTSPDDYRMIGIENRCIVFAFAAETEAFIVYTKINNMFVFKISETQVSKIEIAGAQRITVSQLFSLSNNEKVNVLLTTVNTMTGYT